MSRTRQLIVGLFLLGGLLLFGVGLFWIGDRRLLFEEQLVLNAEFLKLNGLKAGAKVRVSGMDAGEVLEIAVPPDPEAKFQVKFRVLRKLQPILRTDSVASIQSEGIVGSMILRVDAGSGAAAQVNDGDTIRSQEPVELSDILQQASDTVKNLDDAIDDVRGRVDETMVAVGGITTDVSEFVQVASRDLEKFIATSNRMSADVEAIIAKARAGEGTVGKFLNDDKFYEGFTGTMEDAQRAADNIRKTTEQANELLAQLKSSGAVDDIAGTIANIRELTAQAKATLAELKPSGEDGGPGLMADVRTTMANAAEATSALAENMEAMKRNFLLKGFFEQRGFYHLNDLTVEDYLKGKFAPARGRERTWIAQSEIFTTTPDGAPRLTEEGMRKLDSVIAAYLIHAPSTPLIIEGYAATGTESEQFLRSRERASAVRDYLLKKFGLKPNYIGLMPLGAVKSEGGEGYWEGVAVVYFPEKENARSRDDVRMPLQRNGFRPLWGGLRPGASAGGGVAFQETHLATGPVDIGVAARASVRRYLQGDLYVDLPRLWNERLFLETTTTYRNIPRENFFGLGPDSLKENRSDFQLEDVDFTVDFGVRPRRGFRTGVSAGYLAVNAGPGRNKGLPSTYSAFSDKIAPGLGDQPDFAHMGAFLGYDSRDNENDPRTGGSYQLRWTYYDDLASRRFAFRRYEADARHFFPGFNSRGAIGLHGLAAFTDPVAGQRAPFYMLPTAGGSHSLRGYPHHRFRDNNVVIGSIEYRHQLRPFLDVVAFGDAGKAFSEAGHLALGDFRGSAGLGGRIKVGRAVLLGADLGWSSEGPRLWFRGSHSF